MRHRKLWRRLCGCACLLWMLAACGVPATGSSATQTTPPAATSDATSPAATTPDAAVTPPAITPDASATIDLEGTTWRLIEYGPADKPITALADPPVTVKFEAGGKLGGMAGCNSYFGTYKLDSQSFTTSDIGSTEMACLDAERMQQESAFLTALQAATALKRAGDRLTIDYDGGRLHFMEVEPPAAVPLEGTVWHLDAFITGDIARSALSGTTSTAIFADRKVSGLAGCNQYSADYTLMGETVTVNEIVTTKMACDAAIMTQEQEFLNALHAATILTIAGSQLELLHPGGTLVFRASEQGSN